MVKTSEKGLVAAFGATGTAAELDHLLAEAVQHPQVKSILILACDANQLTGAAVDDMLHRLPVPVFGAIFPEILWDGSAHSLGTIVVGLPVAAKTLVIPSLSDAAVDLEQLLERWIDQELGHIVKHRTMFVWVDSLSKRVSELLEALFDSFGLSHNYIGGGAGSLSFAPRPCLFSNQGLLADGAVLALTEAVSGIGVRHGWQSISGPYRVTEVDGHTLRSLNWQPALDVYRYAIRAVTGHELTTQNFDSIASAYPLGIARYGTEPVVRDPVKLQQDNALLCLGDIPADSFIDILTATPIALIDAAGAALEQASTRYTGDPAHRAVLCIDCITRAHFLQDAFQQELQAITLDGVPFFGALTLGEIANNGTDYLEFYNRTAVVSVLEL